MFTGKVDEEVKLLWKDVKLLWNEVNQIKNDLERKPSDDVKEARQASKMCSEYQNRCLRKEEKINEIYSDTSEKSTHISTQYDDMQNINSKITGISEGASDALKNIEEVEGKVALIDKLFEEKDDLDDKIQELTEIYDSANEKHNKINALVLGLVKRKDEIDTLYYEIYGYTDIDEEEDESTYVEGLKDKLEKAYNEITINIKELKSEITAINSDTHTQYEGFITQEEEKYSSLFQKIRELLPDALTAGLSHAYSEKREAEIKEGQRLSKTFSRAIYTLVAISLIPFVVNIYLLLDGKSLESVIFDMPRMVFSILPLYAPVLWLAYSAGKKINLSKRLVEEYTHKEVLSKTFEGLSRQISDIEDETISSDLRVKLLHNILTVSSENPGKLISDYNTADHPLFDGKTPIISDVKDILKRDKSKVEKKQKTNKLDDSKIQEDTE